MPNLTLTKKTPKYDVQLKSYSMTVEVASSEDMEKEVFVKQKLMNFLTDTVDEVFVAVCSPAQLEDLPTLAPVRGSSYFRAHSISLIANTPEHLQGIFDSILYELHKLTRDLNVLSNQNTSETYRISTAGAVKV